MRLLREPLGERRAERLVDVQDERIGRRRRPELAQHLHERARAARRRAEREHGPCRAAASALVTHAGARLGRRLSRRRPLRECVITRMRATSFT